MKKIIILYVVLSVFNGRLIAARPFNTDDAGIVETGMYELETGAYFWKDDAELEIGFKHGITERMDFGFNSGFTILPEQTRGFDSIEMGLKFSIISDFLATSISVSPGYQGYTLLGIITKYFGNTGVDINLGYEAPLIAGAESNLLFSLAFHYLFKSLNTGFEISGTEDEIESWLAGMNCHLNENFAFDIGVSGGFSGDIINSITTGIHCEF